MNMIDPAVPRSRNRKYDQVSVQMIHILANLYYGLGIRCGQRTERRGFWSSFRACQGRGWITADRKLTKFGIGALIFYTEKWKNDGTYPNRSSGN